MTEGKLNKLWDELEDEEKKAEVEYCKMFNSTPEEVPLNQMVRFRSGYCMGRYYGYLAGQPKWHDLRKDPNDLPKGNGLFIIYWKIGTVDNYMVFRGAITEMHKDVIAWCEIPQFKEIEK